MRLGPLDSFWIGSILVIVLTGIYTVLGGLRAVAYTEAMQTVVLVMGSVLVTIFGLKALGGWSELREVCGSEMFNLWKPLVPAGVEATWAPVKEAGRMAWYFNDNYPWLSMLFCAPVIGLWYWCTDQYIVQRASGSTERDGSSTWLHLRRVPQVAARLHLHHSRYDLLCLGSRWRQSAIIRSIILDENGEVIRDEAQKAFPAAGGECVAGGCAWCRGGRTVGRLDEFVGRRLQRLGHLFTMDFYSKLRPNVPQERLVWIGRVATGVMVLIGLAWIPVIQGGKGLYDYLQGVQAYLAPPIFVVFFLGVFWKRLNGAGCLAALIVGFLLGLFRLAIDTPVKLIKDFTYAEGSFLWIVNNMFFQYYSILILIVCAVTMIVVSYATRQPDYEKISGLTFGTLTDEATAGDAQQLGCSVDVFFSALVLVAILAAYLYFRG